MQTSHTHSTAEIWQDTDLGVSTSLSASILSTNSLESISSSPESQESQGIARHSTLTQEVKD